MWSRRVTLGGTRRIKKATGRYQRRGCNARFRPMNYHENLGPAIPQISAENCASHLNTRVADNNGLQ